MWILRNSKGTLEYIKSRCISLSDNIKTSDYTTISHTKLNTMQNKIDNKNAERRYQNLVLAKAHPNSNLTSFFRFVKKRAIYRLSIISFAHAPVHVTDCPVVNVHVDELSSARIWQHKLCATLSANVNVNLCLPIKVYYRICTLRHVRIEINHGSQNVFWVLTWIGRY